MAATPEYAKLSLYVYNTRQLDNRPLLPNEWNQLDYKPDNWFGISYGC